MNLTFASLMSVTCLWDFLQIFLNGQTGVRTNLLPTSEEKGPVTFL